MLKNLTKNELTLDEQQKITEKIIEEGDIDNGKRVKRVKWMNSPSLLFQMASYHSWNLKH